MYDAIFYMSHFMQGISIVQKNGVERNTSSSSFFFQIFLLFIGIELRRMSVEIEIGNAAWLWLRQRHT